jgi:predicted Zn finger-like uncharacterized protein
MLIMKIECPSCHFSAEVDAKIPLNGCNTKCPRCATVFFITPPVTDSSNDNAAAAIKCPKCGWMGNEKEKCSRCGIIFSKIRAAKDTLDMQSDFAVSSRGVKSTPPPGIDYNAKFSMFVNKYKIRLITLMRFNKVVVSVILIACVAVSLIIFRTYEYRKAQQERKIAEERRQKEEDFKRTVADIDKQIGKMLEERQQHEEQVRSFRFTH